jgi:hypothetical protein
MSDKAISAMTERMALDGTEYVEMIAGGDNVKVATPTIKTYTGGAGALQFLGSLDLSSAGEITTIGDASHRILLLELIAVKFDTDNVEPWLRVKIAGGVQSSSYAWNFVLNNSGAFTGSAGSQSDAKIKLGQSQGFDTNEELSGTIKIYEPHGTTKPKRVVWDLATSNYVPQEQRLTGSGIWLGGNDDLTGIDFLAGTGTITAGTVLAYGLKAA